MPYSQYIKDYDVIFNSIVPIFNSLMENMYKDGYITKSEYVSYVSVLNSADFRMNSLIGILSSRSDKSKNKLLQRK